MLFNSIHFFLFLPVITALYYLLPATRRWMLILLASCYFYTAFFWPYLFLLFLLIGIDFYAGKLIEKAQGKQRKRYLWISIAANIGLLSIFKYSNFVLFNFNEIALLVGSSFQVKQLNLLLPIGLSFHTFQSLSYVIDVYRGKQKAETDLRVYANYVLFFPQMVAGPIERFSQLGVQFHQQVKFQVMNIVSGLRLVMYGLFVKMCVADPLAEIVTRVYDAPSTYSSLSVLVALFCFSIQIYADFHGYSTIAIGAARMLGVELMDNFNRPYFASDIHAFWQRWHISLTNWFREYVYYPLGGNRVSKNRWMFNIMLVFMLSGLWHGASWTFVVWGALHGILYLIWFYVKGKSTAPITDPVYKKVSVLVTFFLVSLIWVFFRSADFYQAGQIFSALFHPKNATQLLLPDAFALIPLAFFFILEYQRRGERFDLWFNRHKESVRWAYYTFFLAAILLLSGIHTHPFIYFQF
jgi:alginate O-acetyltransferase complex protein AlgI